MLSCMLNATIRALNSHKNLPCFLICMPDMDILRFINHFGFGISQIIGSSLNWLIKNMEQALDAKKDELRHRRPGALISREPKIIWEAIPHQPGYDQTRIAKFNRILENILVDKKESNIIKLNHAISDISNYNLRCRFLNDKGKDAFWLDLIEKWKCLITVRRNNLNRLLP